MNPETVVQAAGLFAVTNVDDIVVLALFFAQGAGRPHTTRTVAAGQYIGFAGILAVAVAGALGATLLPESALPYFGLLPLALGIRAGVQTWRSRRAPEAEDDGRVGGPTVATVATVTFANGGDNIGVYVPVFANAGADAMTVYIVVFLVLVAVWVAAGRLLATHPATARVLSRWAHVLLPAVLVALGLLILVEGGAFGL